MIDLPTTFRLAALSYSFLLAESADAYTAWAVGGWVVGATAFFGLVLIVKQLFWPERPAAEAYVTKAELQQMQAESKAEMAQLKVELTGRMEGVRNEVGQRIQHMEDNSRQGFHRIYNSQQWLMTNITRLITLEETRTGHRLPPVPLSTDDGGSAVDNP